MAGFTRGIFFVATGDDCRKELRHAITRLLHSNSTLPITVFTDEPDALEEIANVLDAIRHIDTPAFSFIDKLQGFLNAPYDLNVYMDTDTAAVGDISDLFGLLERVDLAAAHGVGAMGNRFNRGAREDLPDCFAEFNTGVVCFRRSDSTRDTFVRWHELYSRSAEQPHDQPAFRQAVYESHLSLYVLPPEYNFLAGFAVLSGRVKVFHSPTFAVDPQGFENFERLINSNTDVRLFVPPGKLFGIRRETA